jgi:hypothetical protein
MREISLLLLLGACASTDLRIAPLKRPFVEKKEKLRQCYTESESFTKKIPGSMEVSLMINSEGSVKVAKIVSTDFKDPNFLACIRGELKKLTFPKDDKRHLLEIHEPLQFVTGIP